MRSACCLAIAVCVLGARPAWAEPAHQLTVKGSDTIGQHLGQELAKAYMASHPDTHVTWESIGSGTAFTGLLEGSADIGAASRAIKSDELAEARELGLRLQEYVLGYDGIAVIAHPSNPVAELSLAQLAGLFAGDVPNWAAVGGRDLRVHVISRPSYSGTHGFFKDTVLVKQGRSDFGPGTEYIEETDRIVGLVAHDPAAISYVGLGFVTGQPLRVLRVQAQPDQPAVAPSEATVRDGSYVIHRPLFLYVREDAPDPAWDLLEFALSDAARQLIVANHFIPTDVSTPVARRRAPDVAARPAAIGAVASGPLPPLHVPFGFNSASLGPQARASLEPLIERLRAGELHAHIIGHADSVGPESANLAVSEARARSVAAYLRSRGVPEARLSVDARASEQPVASNDSLEGRRANRRVDVLVGTAQPQAGRRPASSKLSGALGSPSK